MVDGCEDLGHNILKQSTEKSATRLDQEIVCIEKDDTKKSHLNNWSRKVSREDLV